MIGRRDWLTSASDVVFRQRPVGELPDHRIPRWRPMAAWFRAWRRRCKLSMPWDWNAGAATACRGCAKV